MEAVETKLQCLILHGMPSLQVIMDFDYTTTKYHHNGKRSESCHAMIANTPLLSEAYRKKSWDLFHQYYPMEIDTTMSIQDKIPHMVEWYVKSHDCMVDMEPPLMKPGIEIMVRDSNIHLRDGATTMISALAKEEVPVLVLSAGLGDVVQEVLKQNEALLPNVKIISNFMTFEAGTQKLVGFKEPLIHMFNKDESAFHGDHTAYFDQLRHRHNVILLGDCLGDANMSHGAANPECILKIGFLNDHVQESISAFMEAFDIVLVDDQSMDLMNQILCQITSAPSSLQQ